MKYSKTQVVYHWLTAALIFVMLGTGLAYRFDLADRAALNAHQIAGQLLIVVLALRVGARLMRRRPVTRHQHAAWERLLAGAVHFGLYGTMIAFVITGYVSASALSSNSLIAPVDITFARSDTGEWLLDIHYMLKWVLLGFFGLHLAGALKHLLIDRDDSFSHMTFTSKKQEPPNA
ncbi:cytochrome b/b6 domain-containing protein [Yoonia sp. BS5-3]|uniref:Cytochrome b n=1 Tax=Yoonia phaeophyticola TaxID=3137369 RepID=A0ABZ2V7R7_9RHOB